MQISRESLEEFQKETNYSDYLTDSLVIHWRQIERLVQQVEELNRPDLTFPERCQQREELVVRFKGLLKQQNMLYGQLPPRENASGLSAEAQQQLELLKAADNQLLSSLGQLWQEQFVAPWKAQPGAVDPATAPTVRQLVSTLEAKEAAQAEVRRHTRAAEVLRPRTRQVPAAALQHSTLEVAEDDLPPSFRGSEMGRRILGRCYRARFKKP